jgi:cellulose synthase/poly-beta-1,6-N-acetylglucosamine synthase-like glycosyltransferase
MLSLYVGLTILLIGLYVYLIIYILDKWEAYTDYSQPISIDPSLSLTLLIPARNEAAHIKACLESILASAADIDNTLEIIVLDDHSEDATYAIANSIGDTRIKVIRLCDRIVNKNINAHKKMALAIGLQEASMDYILQLDADVRVGRPYLSVLLSALTNQKPDFIAGPVCLEGSSALQHFQALDMMGMMAVTVAGIESSKWHIANGANMLYKKDLVSFSDSQTASGDDVVTIQTLAAEGRKILFLKSLDATVYTAAMANLREFYHQRIRWATKNKYQSSLSMKVMMAIPFINCLVILAHPFMAIWAGMVAWVLLGLHIMSKVMIDYIYLKSLSTFFGKEKAMGAFGYASVVYIFYIAIIGVASLVVKKYTWKGREVT